MKKPLHFETLAVHAGRNIDPGTAAVAQPIHLSTTLERGADGEYPLGFADTRETNPNRKALTYASGLAAATTALLASPATPSGQNRDRQGAGPNRSAQQ